MKKCIVVFTALLLISAMLVSAETKTVTHKLDFEDILPGRVDAGDYADKWEIYWPSDNLSSLIEDGDNNVLNIIKYSQIAYTEQLISPYTFSLKLKGTTAGDRAAIFARSSEELFLKRSNSIHGEFFEADGASTAGIGATGLCIYPFAGSNTIKLFVKAYDANEGSYIANHTADIDITGALGGTSLYSEFIKIKIEDTGTELKVYVKDTLVATVVLSSETAAYPELLTNSLDTSSAEYVKRVTVKDGNGSDILTVDNTLLCAEYSRVGFGTRNITGCYADDFEVIYEEETTETPEPAGTAEATGNPTAEPLENTTVPTQTKTPDPDKDRENDNNMIIVIAAAGITAAAVVATIVYLAVKKRKKI